MRQLLILGVLVLAPGAAAAKPHAIKCPGDTTVEMRYCAEKSWEQSDAQLRQKVSKKLMEQWHEATKAVCSAAYAPYKDGTIYPQKVRQAYDKAQFLEERIDFMNRWGDLLLENGLQT